MSDQKSRVTKTKTFTGCWTCRALKVKCDCTRPQCLRCLRAGKVCGGYDVTLTWVNGADSDRQRPTAIKRQAMSIPPIVASHVMDTDSIDAALAQLEAYESDFVSATMATGPFGVFSVSPPPAGGDTTQVPPAEYLVATESRREEQHIQVLQSSNSWLTASRNGDRQRIAHSSDTMGAAMGRTPGSELCKSFPMLTETSHAGIVDILCTLPAVPRPPKQGNPLVQLLLDHYTEHVTKLLQPVARQNNTYKSVHAPVALKAWDALCRLAEDASASVAASDVAILFSLLATSAVHLRVAGDTSANSIFHDLRHEAYSNLSLAIQDSESLSLSRLRHHDEAKLHHMENIMSASLTLVTLDVMHGEMDQFWTHLTASMRISELLRPAAEVRPRSRSMIDICTFLHIISESTNWSAAPVAWDSNSYASMDGGRLFYNYRTLETTYGITVALAGLIADVTRVARSMQFYRCRATDPSLEFQTACKDLSKAVGSLPYSQIITESSKDSDVCMQALLKDHVEAFALSIRVHYHACVLPCSREQMDELVQSVLGKLDSIEQQKRSHEFAHTRTATITWPGFIASCEARQEHRQSWRLWWTHMRSYGIGNIETLWTIVQEAWSLRDIGSVETPAWLPILRAKQKFILAV